MHISKWVVHCRKEPFDVYCARPNIWGNNWSHLKRSKAPYKAESRPDAVLMHKVWVLNQPDLIRRIKAEIEGKVLGCWCDPLPCHCDILAYIANQPLFKTFEQIEDYKWPKIDWKTIEPGEIENVTAILASRITGCLF